MGKSKKFIKKDEGVKFYLVHRSQRDPLYLDETLGEHVLVPADPDANKSLVESINRMNISGKKKESEEMKKKRIEEQQKFGIYYEDDYNYLQHLKVLDDEKTELEPLKTTKVGSVLIKDDENEENNIEDINSKLKLPSSVFASKYEEDVGYFNQAAPDHDPKIGWDPDIVKILDEDSNLDIDDGDNELEDDFFIKANAQDNLKSKKRETNDDLSDDLSGSDYEEYEEDDEDFKDFDKKSRFSNYSMTSSVIRRNEVLKQLDEHFENIYAQYDDDQIGALDTEDIEGFRIGNDAVLESALEEFNKIMAKNLYKSEKRLKEPKLETLVEHQESEDIYDSSEEGSNQDEEKKSDDENRDSQKKNNYEFLKFTTKKNKEDRLDCESVISTYSNLYNRPAVISDKNEKNKIELSKKTGLPVGVLESKPISQKQLEIIDHRITRILPEIQPRRLDETKEEKKARKNAVKEHRRERRIEKKINKLSFKNETAAQLKTINNKLSNHIKMV